MKKIPYIFLGAVCAAVLSVPFFSYALTTLITNQGGTGTTTPSGLLYGDNGATSHLNTATLGAGCTFSAGTLSCSGTGSAFPFTPQSYGNSTSTTLAFLNGFFSSASSTVSGSFHLGLSSGELAINSSGLVYSGATTTAGTGLSYSGGAFNVTGLTTTQFASANVSQWTNDASYSAFPFSPTTNFGAVANATSTPIWFKSGIQASSTLNISGVITSAATAANVLPFASTTAISSSGSAYFATSGGGVGIGITNPSHSLQIGPSPASVSANDSFTVASTTYGYFSLSGTAANSNVGFALNQGTATGSGGNAFSVMGIVGTNTDAFYGLSTTLSGKNSGDILWQDFYGSAFHSILSVPVGTNNAIFGGLVGVGTSTPYSKLSVWGADTTAGHRAFEVTNSASTTLFAVDNAGAVTQGTSATSTFTGGITVKGSVVSGIKTPGIILTASTTVAIPVVGSTTPIGLPSGLVNQTLDGIACYTDTGTMNVWVGTGLASTTMINASTTQNFNAYSTNNTFTALQKRYFVAGTPSGAPTMLSCTFKIEDTSY